MLTCCPHVQIRQWILVCFTFYWLKKYKAKDNSYRNNIDIEDFVRSAFSWWWFWCRNWSLTCMIHRARTTLLYSTGGRDIDIMAGLLTKPKTLKAPIKFIAETGGFNRNTTVIQPAPTTDRSAHEQSTILCSTVLHHAVPSHVSRNRYSATHPAQLHHAQTLLLDPTASTSSHHQHRPLATPSAPQLSTQKSTSQIPLTATSLLSSASS